MYQGKKDSRWLTWRIVGNCYSCQFFLLFCTACAAEHFKCFQFLLLEGQLSNIRRMSLFLSEFELFLDVDSVLEYYSWKKVICTLFPEKASVSSNNKYYSVDKFSHFCLLKYQSGATRKNILSQHLSGLFLLVTHWANEAHLNDCRDYTEKNTEAHKAYLLLFNCTWKET